MFCLPFGIVTIVYGSQVKTQLRFGDDQGAYKASKKAEKWFLFRFIPATIILVLVLIAYKYYCSNSLSCEVQFFNFWLL
ncbi:CD225/dispanin family protein [Okeania sp. SIO1I7]|uniref:CD225/dispanin family protein n=1 Tax=Okeania sp. SIO1I7 TaxID=2607772 RepID=UPI003453511A